MIEWIDESLTNLFLCKIHCLFTLSHYWLCCFNSLIVCLFGSFCLSCFFLVPLKGWKAEVLLPFTFSRRRLYTRLVSIHGCVRLFYRTQNNNLRACSFTGNFSDDDSFTALSSSLLSVALLTVNIVQYRALESAQMSFVLGNPGRNLLKHTEIKASIQWSWWDLGRSITSHSWTFQLAWTEQTRSWVATGRSPLPLPVRQQVHRAVGGPHPQAQAMHTCLCLPSSLP